MRQLTPTSTGDVDLLEAYGRLTPGAGQQFAGRANMIASVDGAASSGGLSGALGGPGDKAVFAALRTLTDIVMIGSGTMRSEGYGPARLGETARARPAALGISPAPPIAV